LCKVQNFLASRVISSSGMLSYCSSKAAVEEDKENSKANVAVVKTRKTPKQMRQWCWWG
jgi:hypothetical protein